ncbi:MAG TPA: hypothetical protein VEI26_01425 [Terriglobales bacterium]|nr:hypothetical protein [Terriglobales bacterium]
MDRLQIRNDLPELRVGQLGPGRHSFSHVAVDQQPMEISGRGLLLDPFTAEGRPFFCALSTLAMTLRTMLQEYIPPGIDGNRLSLEWIRSIVVFRWDMRHPGTISSGLR